MKLKTKWGREGGGRRHDDIFTASWFRINIIVYKHLCCSTDAPKSQEFKKLQSEIKKMNWDIDLVDFGEGVDSEVHIDRWIDFGCYLLA